MSVLVSPYVLVEEACHSGSRFDSWRILLDTRSDCSAALIEIEFILSLGGIAVYPIYPVNVFVESVIAHLEAYFGDKKIKENKNPYYKFVKDESFCNKVLAEFGIEGPHRHIINGHMPVKVKDGESPVSGNGKHIIIDGGLSKAYHKRTGIGGYTLMSNSHGLYLTTHAPFCKTREAIKRKLDLKSETTCIELYKKRVKVKDTDNGKWLQDQIDVLKLYLQNYYHMDIN